jgi:hypothetical protein
VSGRPRPPDKRRYLRVPLKIDVQLGDAWESGDWAIDLSRQGMGLQARIPKREGERLRLRFRLAPDSAPIEVEAEVVWCMLETDLTPGLHFYEMGVRFVSLPPEHEEALSAFVEDSACFWPDEEDPPAGPAAAG